jgi:predicted acylesterase/phospholipase RssA
MLKLQKLFPDRDLLREVDVISSVSGGSMTAAYYAISQDRDPRIDDTALAEAVVPPPPAEPIAPGKLRRRDNVLTCSQALTQGEEAKLRARLAEVYLARDPAHAARRITDLCRGAPSNRVWDEATVRDLMTRDYVWRWIGNWFWPTNIGQYWFTAFDRSDIMAQTLADNLYDVAGWGWGLGLTFADLNPERPHLIINTTNATRSESTGDRFPFGSVFTFTTEDFSGRIRSNISRYSVARAVMASASFPVVFANMTLRDFRPNSDERPRYVHVFDGGNSDNLGLAALKRALLETALAGRIARRIVVISIDAFTHPVGTSSLEPDSRGGWFNYVLDTNLTASIDALLQANRENNLQQFRDRSFNSKECHGELPSYPARLCEAKDKLDSALDLKNRMIFYHVKFDDTGDAESEDINDYCDPAKLRLVSWQNGFDDAGARIEAVDWDARPKPIKLAARLDQIPTSLSISDADQEAIDTAVDLIVNDGNECLCAIRAIVAGTETTVREVHDACSPEQETGAVPTRKFCKAPVRKGGVAAQTSVAVSSAQAWHRTCWGKKKGAE